jgi:hypothetical protein
VLKVNCFWCYNRSYIYIPRGLITSQKFVDFGFVLYDEEIEYEHCIASLERLWPRVKVPVCFYYIVYDERLQMSRRELQKENDKMCCGTLFETTRCVLGNLVFLCIVLIRNDVLFKCWPLRVGFERMTSDHPPLACRMSHAQVSLVKLPPQLNCSRRNGTQRIRTTSRRQLRLVMAIEL